MRLTPGPADRLLPFRADHHVVLPRSDNFQVATAAFATLNTELDDDKHTDAAAVGAHRIQVSTLRCFLCLVRVSNQVSTQQFLGAARSHVILRLPFRARESC